MDGPTTTIEVTHGQRRADGDGFGFDEGQTADSHTSAPPDSFTTYYVQVTGGIAMSKYTPYLFRTHFTLAL